MSYNTTIYKHMKYKLSLLLIFLFTAFASLAQPHMTKIKDGTISGTTATPNSGVILELESVNKGFLAPRLTTQQRDAIAVVNRTDGLLIYNKTTGCFNYWSTIQDTWLSLCGTPPPAVFEVTQCTSIIPNGNFKQGEFFTSSNFLTIPVTVTQAGTYELTATTENGYYFTTKGTFPTAGTYTLFVPGTGTPNNGYNSGDQGDKLTFLLNNKENNCEKYIFVERANVNYSILCTETSIEGAYMIGQTLTNTHKIVLKVNVTSIGYWSITTNTSNGFSFRGSGNFSQVGEQTIELLGTGTPINSGANSFTFTTNSDQMSAACTTDVTVKAIKYTVDCSQATIAGIYKQDEPLTSSNTVTIKVDVQATGETSISTNPVAGIHFTSGPLSFDSIGERNVVLTAVGTPTTPGDHTFTLNAASGMISPCSFDVTVTAQPVAYNLICSSIQLEGAYAPNIAMTTTNKMTLNVNVQYPGAYSIATNTVNGVTFSASGNFTMTGTQEVVLTATGTPVTGGIHRYTITTNSSVGANTCNRNIDYLYRKMNVLGLGGGAYQLGSASGSESSRAIPQAAGNFGPNGTVKMEGITIFNGGTGQGNTLKNNINSNKIDVVVIGYNYQPNAASIAILADFVKNKKGVLIHSQENGATSTENLINAIAYSPNTAASGTGQTYINPILNLDDPILNGPFGDIKGKNTGSDVNNSYYVTGYSSEFLSFAHQEGRTDRSWFLKHNSLGYVYIGDSGWTAGSASNNSTTIWPAAITSGGTPISKTYNGGTIVFNSIMYANTLTWAIKYVQENTNVNYQIP